MISWFDFEQNKNSLKYNGIMHASFKYGDLKVEEKTYSSTIWPKELQRNCLKKMISKIGLHMIQDTNVAKNGLMS